MNVHYGMVKIDVVVVVKDDNIIVGHLASPGGQPTDNARKRSMQMTVIDTFAIGPSSASVHDLRGVVRYCSSVYL